MEAGGNEMLKKLIYIPDSCFATARNSFSPASIQNYRIGSLFRCHAPYYCFNAFECIIINIQILYSFANSWYHSHKVLYVPHLLYLLYLSDEIIKIELIL